MVGRELPYSCAKAPGDVDGRYTREQVREQAHVGCAARVDVVAEAGEFDVRQTGAKIDQRFDVAPAKFGAEDDD